MASRWWHYVRFVQPRIEPQTSNRKAKPLTNKKCSTTEPNTFFFSEIELGSKALGCFGGCDFNGIPHNVYWTHLESTAMAGSNQIVLVDAVDWEVGHEIVITTTGYRCEVLASVACIHEMWQLENRVYFVFFTPLYI